MAQKTNETAGPMHADHIRREMSRIERREWWLWSNAVMVMLLLTLALASFAFPHLMEQAHGVYSFYVSQAVHGLIGLVLLFNVYTVYQQLQIHRIRRQLTQQFSALGRVEVLAEEVYKLAVLDPLTGLYNRRSGEQRLTQEISRAERHGRPLTVLLIDLDDLKQVNDLHGHPAGDQVIRLFAERLNRAIRGSDLAVRLGGDEFMVLLPECKPEEVRHVLNRLSGLKIEYEGRDVPVAFSAGWTNYRSGESADDLMKRADNVLYFNKRGGKEPTEPKAVPV